MLIQPMSPFALARTRPPVRSLAEPFRLSDPSRSSRPAAPATIGSLSSLQTLLAVQEVSTGLTERRRRALRRGCELLDRLGRLQIAMLSGADDPECLDQLRMVLTTDAGDVDDSDLTRVLEEIDVRAAVEIAKRERGAN